MPKSMGAYVLLQLGTAHRHLDVLVDYAGFHMMATGDTSTRVDGDVPGGEDILPAPLRGGIPILPSQRMGKVDCPMALRQILLMQGFDPGEVVLKERDERRGKGRETVLIAFSRTDGQLFHGIINVLDSEPD